MGVLSQPPPPPHLSLTPPPPHLPLAPTLHLPQPPPPHLPLSPPPTSPPPPQCSSCWLWWWRPWLWQTPPGAMETWRLGETPLSSLERIPLLRTTAGMPVTVREGVSPPTLGLPPLSGRLRAPARLGRCGRSVWSVESVRSASTSRPPACSATRWWCALGTLPRWCPTWPPGGRATGPSFRGEFKWQDQKSYQF